MRGEGCGADFASGNVGPTTEAIGLVEEQIALRITWADYDYAHLLGIIRMEQGREVDVGEDVNVADEDGLIVIS